MTNDDLDFDQDDIMRIPRGTKCFLDLERLAQEERTTSRWVDYESWYVDQFFAEMCPPPPPPTTLPEKAAAFLTRLGQKNLYSTRELQTLCEELTKLWEQLAIYGFQLDEVTLLPLLEIPTRFHFGRLFRSLSSQERIKFITFVLKEMDLYPRAEAKQVAEKILMIAVCDYLLAQFKHLRTAQSWDEIRHFCRSDCRVTHVLDAWTTQGLDLLLLFLHHNLISAEEEKLGALCFFPVGALRGTFATLAEDHGRVDAFLTLIAHCESRYVSRYPTRNQTLRQRRFVLCGDLVRCFVDRTTLSNVAIDRLAWLLATRLNAISSLHSFLRDQVRWNKVISPKHFDSLGDPRLDVFPQIEYLVLCPSGTCYFSTIPCHLTKRVTEVPAWPTPEVLPHPTEFRVIFNVELPSSWQGPLLLFFTMRLPGRVVVDYLTWAALDLSPYSEQYSEQFLEKWMQLFRNREVEGHFIPLAADSQCLQLPGTSIHLRFGEDNNPIELIFTDLDGTTQSLRVDPDFKKYLIQTITEGWFPKTNFKIRTFLELLRKGFAVQGWVIRYRAEEYRFFMHKYGVRVPLIGGLQLADLFIGCFPQKRLAEYVRHEVEIFEAPVWFAIGPWCFQFDPTKDTPFSVTLQWEVMETLWVGRPPLTPGIHMEITRDDFFQAAKIWEYLEVEGLEEDFLQGEWHSWVCKFYPPQEIPGVFGLQGTAGFFPIWDLYQFFLRKVKGQSRHTRSKLEFDLMMKKLGPGKCWFPTDIYCELIAETETHYVIERTTQKRCNRSSRTRSYRGKIPKEAVRQLKTILQKHPTHAFTAKQVQELFDWKVAPLDVVRVLVCLRKATLDVPSPTNALQFRFQPDPRST